MWELHTELLSKDLQGFLFDNIKMKDGVMGGKLTCLSIFDVLTALKHAGLLQMVHKRSKMKYQKRQEIKKELYQEWKKNK